MLMNAYELQEYAKDNGFDSLEFMMISPRFTQCKFLDAYCGMIQIPEIGEGFLILKEMIKKCGFDNLKFVVITKEESEN